MEKEYDYIIVGSGFGGSVASLRLSEKGYSVLTIEKGKRFNPDDFPRTNRNLRKYLWKPGVLGGRITLDNSDHKKVPAYIEVGQRVMEAYARKADGIAQNIILEVMFNRSTTAHILGGCPMSESIREGVVNPDLSVHGYPGMYVVDGSVIQGNIGVNPSFTILAMAGYAMSKIPEKRTNQKKKLIPKLQTSI